MIMRAHVVETWASRSQLRTISMILSLSYQDQEPSFPAVKDMFNRGNGMSWTWSTLAYQL